MELFDKKYSFLMSVYDKENPDFLRLSIESMLQQTLAPNEIIIVKDGPLCQALDMVIDDYKDKHDELFTVISLEKNVGLGLALNEGLKISRNELIARMDSDDISLKERCELQVKEFELDEKLSIVGTITDEFYVDPDNIVTSRVVPLRHNEILKFSKRRSPFNHPTVMYKKSAVLKFGGYQDIKRKEDIDLFVRMLHGGCLSMNISKSLLLFRSNEDNFYRRKSWDNCKSYISVIHSFWRMGHSSIIDLLYVSLGQIVMFMSPIWLLKLISNVFLRKTLNNKS